MLNYLRLVLLSSFLIGSRLLIAGPLNTYKDLSSSDQESWYKLLHAKFYSGKSQLDGELFFLSPQGRVSPSMELSATIAAFKNPNSEAGWFHYPAQCVFRARFQFLKERGFLEGIKEVECPMFDEWKKGINADSLSLIFSSAYPNNPPSMFGHMLIRLNQKDKTNDLLDYAAAYSAIPNGNDSGLWYVYKGATGGYRGLIEVTKYYTKVNDYTHQESRDLIEYKLNLTPKELDRFIDHLWEIYQTTYINYYFLSQNCSSVLADLLTATLLDRDDINKHEHWFYMPHELLKKIISEKNLLNSVYLRPSSKKEIENALEKLNESELLEVKNFLSDKEIPADYQNTKVIDVLLDIVTYQHKADHNYSDKAKSFYRNLLLRRTKLPASEKKTSPLEEAHNRPENSHDPMKLSFFTRTEKSHSLLGLEFKNGYHNIMNKDEGFESFSQVDFLSGSALYDKKLNRLSFDELMIVDIISLHSLKFYDPQFSWALTVKVDRDYTLNCELCHKINLSAKAGTSYKNSDIYTVYGMLGLFSETSKHLNRGERIGPSANFGFVYNIQSKMKVGLFDEWRLNLLTKNSSQNVGSVKINYFKSGNEDIILEYKNISTIGAKLDFLKTETTLWQLSYGRYF